MSSVFHEDLDEHSPLITTPQPNFGALQPQTNTSSTTTLSPPSTPQPAMSTTPPPPPTPQPVPEMSSVTPPLPQDRDAKPTTTITTTDITNKTPVTPTPRLPKVSTNVPWGAPAGLSIRGPNDEMLLIFRRAVGINSDLSAPADSSSLESGRRKAVGVYADILKIKKAKAIWFAFLNTVLWISYFLQIVIGAGLTALGPGAAMHPYVITGLGVLNTVIAGFLALVKGQGLPERLRKDEMEFRRLQDWIEETEALLAVGVIGRDRKEVGLLVEMAFKKYNAAKASEENNRPESYVPQAVEAGPAGAAGSRPGSVSGASGASLSVPRY